MRFASVRDAALLVVLAATTQSLAQPDNDSFAYRDLLVGDDLHFMAFLVEATMEPGEPNHAGPDAQAANSVWYRWVAPADGCIQMSRWDGMAVLYTGSRLDALQLVYRLDTYTPYLPVQGGIEYQLVIAAYAGAYVPPAVQVNMQFFPDPHNDLFSARYQLSGSSNWLSGLARSATREPGEPNHADVPGERTLWWSWTAPSDGIATLAPKQPLIVAVYKGATLAGLSRVASGWLDPGSFQNRTLTLSVTRGQTYAIVLAARSLEDSPLYQVDFYLSNLRVISPPDGTVLPQAGSLEVRLAGLPDDPAANGYGLNNNGGYRWWWESGTPKDRIQLYMSGGQYELQAFVDAGERSYLSPPVRVSVVVPNDQLEDRLPLTGTDVTVAVDLSGSTLEPGEPATGFGSIWYGWTAPFDGMAVLNSAGSVDVFTGDGISTLQAVQVFSDYWGTRYFRAEANWEYLLQAEPGPFSSAWYDFRLQLVSIPPNDLFSDAEVLSSPEREWLPDCAYAWQEAGEPVADPRFAWSTLWYRWIPSESGALFFGTVGDDPGVSLSIFEGDDLGSLGLVGGPSWHTAAFVRPGRTYHLQVGTVSPGRPAHLLLHFEPRDDNDAMADALPLPGDQGDVRGNNGLATREPGEPGSSPDLDWHTLWYQWTAPGDGVLDLRTFDETGENEQPWMHINVYADDGGGGLTQVAGRYRSAQAAVMGGWTYRIQLESGRSAGAMAFLLRYAYYPPVENDWFDFRREITGTDIEFDGSNWGATREWDEPKHSGLIYGASAWWTWRAPATGFVTLRGKGRFSLPYMGVYQGSTLPTLKLVPSRRLGDRGIVQFAATRNEWYQIVVDYPKAQFEPIGYDEVECRLSLTTARLASPADQATFTLPAVPEFRITTLDPQVDGAVAGVEYVALAPDSLLTIGSYGTNSTPPFSLQPATLPAGTHTLVAALLYTDGSSRLTPPVVFNIKPEPPPNDNLAAAQLIEGRASEVSGLLVGCGLEPGEASHSGVAESGSVWYAWTAPASGKASLSLVAACARVYTGSTMASLAAVTPAEAALNFDATAGVRYLIAVPKLVSPPWYFRDDFTLQLRLTTVGLAEPSPDAELWASTPIALRAETTESVSNIEAVEFLDNGVFLGQAVTPPYTFTWQEPPAGLHPISVRVRLKDGQTSESPSVVTLRIRPTNDIFGSTPPVTGNKVTFSGTTQGTAPDPAEGFWAQSTWHTWHAPGEGFIIVRYEAPKVFVYSGDRVDALTLVAESTPYYYTFLGIIPAEGDYHFQVGAPSDPWTGEYKVWLEFVPAQKASNDDFQQAIPITGSSADLVINTFGATPDPTDPWDWYNRPVATTWWEWTPPVGGAATFSFGEAPYGALRVSLFVGTSPSDLQWASSYFVWTVTQPGFYANVAPGQHYYLMCDAASGVVHNTPCTITLEPGMLNDNFSQRTPLSGRLAVSVGQYYGGTHEPGEPSHHPSGTGRGSMWWSWTAPSSGPVEVAAMNAPATVAVYQGDSLDRLTLVARGDNSARFDALAGSTYQIAWEDTAGLFGWHIGVTVAMKPENDNFIQAERLTGLRTEVVSTTRHATREFREPYHARRYGGHSVWYVWRAPLDGPVNLYASGMDLSLGVYEGNRVDQLREVASAAGWPAVGLTFQAIAGHDYYFAVDGAYGSQGEFGLSLDQPQPPGPSFLDVALAGGQFRCRIEGLMDQPTIIETSSDLEQWDALESIPAGHETYDLAWPADSDEPARFFRARRDPQGN